MDKEGEVRRAQGMECTWQGSGANWEAGRLVPLLAKPRQRSPGSLDKAGESKVAVRSPSLTSESLGGTHQLCGCLGSGHRPCGRHMLPTHDRSLGNPREQLLLTRAVSRVYGDGPASPLTCVDEGGYGDGVHVCPVGGLLPDTARLVAVLLRLSGSDRDLAACLGAACPSHMPCYMSPVPSAGARGWLPQARAVRRPGLPAAVQWANVGVKERGCVQSWFLSLEVGIPSFGR